MAYSELIKNFEKIREYMRGFYVYGFMSRNDYTQKSARSYDDERRRIESWLSDNMRFTMTPEGKNVFISIDSRVYRHNPLYRAWKAKSFTDGDITLHFIIFDILYSPDISLTLSELTNGIDSYLAEAKSEATFDESTIRKKLAEYVNLGIIVTHKHGKKLLYSRAPATTTEKLSSALDFFSESAPLGIIGSYMLDKLPEHKEVFSFKHHYITDTMDNDVLALLFDAMNDKCFISVTNSNLRRSETKQIKILPLKIYISVQSGRQNLVAYNEKTNRFVTIRLDRMSDIKKEEPCVRFDALRQQLKNNERYMWGVNCKISTKHLVHIEFDIVYDADEQYIADRLLREKRCGSVEEISNGCCRFSADVFDATEMLPWLRTFICRITRFECSDKAVEATFKADLEEMYRLYGLNGGDEY